MKIISGFQTGADRAGIDAAIALNLEYGGYVPKGRLAEDGVIDAKYVLTELDTLDYPTRTNKNIDGSDLTIIFVMHDLLLTKGSALTVKVCQKLHKPHMLLNIALVNDDNAVSFIKQMISKTNPRVINIAGERESKAPGIYERVKSILTRALCQE